MRPQTALGWAFALLTVVILIPALVTRLASAAQLPVTAAPLQTWDSAAVASLLTSTFTEREVPPSSGETSSGPATTSEDTSEPLDPAAEPAAPQPGQPAVEEPSRDEPERVSPDAAAADPRVDLTECGDLDEYDDIVLGSTGNDTLTAGAGRQVLVGLGGDDVLDGGQGDDCLLGGRGDDQLDGADGTDVLTGGLGEDALDAGGDEGDACVEAEARDELVDCGEPTAAVDPMEPPADDSARPESPGTEGPQPESPQGAPRQEDEVREADVPDAGAASAEPAPTEGAPSAVPGD